MEKIVISCYCSCNEVFFFQIAFLVGPTQSFNKQLYQLLKTWYEGTAILICQRVKLDQFLFIKNKPLLLFKTQTAARPSLPSLSVGLGIFLGGGGPSMSVMLQSNISQWNANICKNTQTVWKILNWAKNNKYNYWVCRKQCSTRQESNEDIKFL